MTPQVEMSCPELRLSYDPSLSASPDYGVYEGLVLRAEYPVGNVLPADLLSKRFDLALSAEWERLGIESGQKALLQIHLAECWPAAYRIQTKWPLPSESDYLPIPLVVLPPASPMTDSIGGVALPMGMIFTLTHELTEFALISRPRGTLLIGFKPLPFVHVGYETRWFREGLASYVAARVCGRLGLKPPIDFDLASASLARTGPAILQWSQTRSSGDLSIIYYAAAMGLVDRIVSQSSPEAMKTVLAELQEYDYIDGARLGRVIERVTGRSPEGYFAAEAVGPAP